MSEEKHVAPWVVEYLVDGKGNSKGQPFQTTLLAEDEDDAKQQFESKNWVSWKGKKLTVGKIYRTSIYD